MSRIMPLAVCLAGLGVALPRSETRADDRPGDVLKVVVHVNFAESQRQGHGLKNIANLLKDAPDAQVEVVCHGDGIGLVATTRTGHADAVAALVKQGVRFVACENTMRSKSIRKEDLLPGIGTVPTGTVEIIRKQKEGYAYFKP